MSKIHSPSARDTQYNGTHGNLCVAVMTMSLAAVAANTEIVMGTFDNALTVVDWRCDHEPLGAGVTLDVGFGYSGDHANEPEAIANGLSANAAGSKSMSSAPISAKQAFSELLLRPQGGTANGKVTLTLFYVNQA